MEEHFLTAFTVQNGLDEATAELILQLHLEDSKELFEISQNRSKMPEGFCSDFELALKLNQEEIEHAAMVISDRKLTKSINEAVRTDAHLLRAAVQQEQLARSDRAIACRLAGIAVPQLPDPVPVIADSIEDRLLDVMSALFVEEPNEERDVSAEATDVGSYYSINPGGNTESSKWAMVRWKPLPPRLTCVICQEDGRFFVVTPMTVCNDAYCRTCLQDLFNRSFKDESLFPPKCCGNIIDPKSVRLYLTAEIVETYKQKKIEFDDPNRTYCSNPTCSSYIPQQSILHDRARCTRCTTETCTMCKAEWHSGDCPADTGLQLVLAKAAEEGWQRCGSCRQMVEHLIGCNHMTVCRCGYQFCYVCGAKWRSCNCPHYHEHRLLAQARDRVSGARPQENVLVEAQVDAAVMQLQEQHICRHGRYTREEGTHECHACGDMLFRFIFICNWCNIQHCGNCRYNR